MEACVEIHAESQFVHSGFQVEPRQISCLKNFNYGKQEHAQRCGPIVYHIQLHAIKGASCPIDKFLMGHDVIPDVQ